MRRPDSFPPPTLLAALLALGFSAVRAAAQEGGPPAPTPTPPPRTIPGRPRSPTVYAPGYGPTPPPTPTPPPAAAPVATATPTPAVTVATAAQIIHDVEGSLVIVEGHEGAGSGFICALDGQKYLITNDHVIAGNTGVNFTLLDGSPVRVGAAASAVGHDMLRLAVAPTLTAFNVLDRVGDNLLVGDDVVVLGNEKGARVITPIIGKVVGLGPNLVEVDAPFQPGNSGSPIIQVRSGKVIGIATYVRKEHDELGEGSAPAARSADAPAGGAPVQSGVRLRRFGYRLDSVKAWQPVVWPEFVAEAALLKKVDLLTDDILALIKDVNTHQGHFSTGIHYDPAIERPLLEFFDAMGRRPSPSDALAARQRLLDTLRRVCQGDLAEVRPRLRYDYFQREAVETQRTRDELAKGFDEAFKAQGNRTGR